MHYLLFTLFFAVAFDCGLNAMDLIPIPKSLSGQIGKKEGTKRKKPRSQSSIDRIKPIHNNVEHSFILAAKKNDIVLVEDFLSNIYFNPNVQTTNGTTALMLAVINKHNKVIDLLLNDYRTDTSIPNIQGSYAHTSLENGDPRRPPIFSRFSLDCAVNSYVTPENKKNYQNGLLLPATVRDLAAIILAKAKQPEKRQENDDREMPAESLCKATLEFIIKMFNFRITLSNT